MSEQEAGQNAKNCHIDLKSLRRPLKTLFHLMETPLKKLLKLWCLCCMMMFRWTNKQPEIQKFWNLCGLYQDICDWISPLNKRSGWPFILTQQSMGRNVYGISGHLQIFAFLKHLMVLLRCNFFQGFIFTPYQRHWSHVGTCSSDF